MRAWNLVAAVLVGALLAPGLPPPARAEVLAWQVLPLDDRPALPAHAMAEGGLRLHGAAGATLAVRPLAGWLAADTCLSWRWRVDLLPPPGEPDEAGQPPRPLALWVGFRAEAERMALAHRYAHGLVQFRSPMPDPPGFVLAYAWPMPGAGQGWHGLPLAYLASMGRLRVLPRQDRAQPGWVEETVRLAADFQAVFGGPPTQVMLVALHAEAGPPGLDAAIDSIRLHRCPPPPG
jgi:hypothetical protein